MMSTNSPFVFLDPVIPPLFAGRKKEMEYINKALFQTRESLIIYGNDAIGKSSILSTVYTEMKKRNNSKIFPVRINAFDFVKAVETNFLGMVVHQICAEIWTKLLKKNYSELIEDTMLNARGDVFNGQEEKAIKRVFKIVSNEKLTSSGKLSKELGGRLFLEGRVSQENDFSIERKELAPFEFLHLLDELNSIIQSYGFDSILILCDELNHFPEKTNTDILRNYFSIFLSSKIQFAIIAVNPEVAKREEAKKLIESFNCRLEIGTFSAHTDVDELLANSYTLADGSFLFENGASELLFTLADAHPWWIQKICDASFNRIAGKDHVISHKIIESAFKDFSEEIKIYKSRISAGLPFRKYNLI